MKIGQGVDRLNHGYAIARDDITGPRLRGGRYPVLFNFIFNNDRSPNDCRHTLRDELNEKLEDAGHTS